MGRLDEFAPALARRSISSCVRLRGRGAGPRDPEGL